MFSDVLEVRCKCFHMDVAKIVWDIAYVVMAIDVCCKRLFQMFYLCFSDISCKCVYLNIAYVSYICCKCFYLESGCCICLQ
jgi:hypothetical protein